METILCAHPVVIWNPNVRKYVRQGLGVYHDEDMSRSFRIQLNSSGEAVFSCPKNVTSIDAIHYYMIYDGKRVEPFLVVPCGKCHLCISRKKQDLSFRFEAETARYTQRPLFVTLTFDEQHVPFNMPDFYEEKRITYGNPYINGQLPVDDDFRSYIFSRSSLTLDNTVVQRFFKRLRMSLKRIYNTRTDFRYYCVGEYGSHTLRPHYHMVLWNFPFADELGMIHVDDAKYLSYVTDIIRASWQQADGVNGVQVEFCGEPRRKSKKRLIGNSGSSSGCAKYVAKYVFKDSKKPSPLAASNHSLQSVATGGIGKHYIQGRAYEFYEAPQRFKVQVANPFTREVTKSCLPATYRRYLFPCFSTFIGKRLFSRLRELAVLVSAFDSLEVDDDHFCLYDISPVRPLLDDFCSRTTAEQYVITSSVLKSNFWSDSKECLNSLAICALRIYHECMNEYYDRVQEWEIIQCCKERRKSFMDSLPIKLYDVDMLEEIQALHDLSLRKQERF